MVAGPRSLGIRRIDGPATDIGSSRNGDDLPSTIGGNQVTLENRVGKLRVFTKVLQHDLVQAGLAPVADPSTRTAVSISQSGHDQMSFVFLVEEVVFVWEIGTFPDQGRVRGSPIYQPQKLASKPMTGRNHSRTGSLAMPSTGVRSRQSRASYVTASGQRQTAFAETI